MRSGDAADPRFGNPLEVDRLSEGFGKVVSLDAFDRAGELLHLE
jgi:hypothetical protein